MIVPEAFVAVMPEGAVGGVDALVTVTVTVDDDVRLPLSTALAVIVWVPTTRLLRVNVPPVPSAPWRFEVHVIDAVSEPSCVSFAEPVNVIVAPETNDEPLPGEVIATVGAVLLPPPPPPPSAAATSSTPPVTQRPESDATGRAVDMMRFLTCV